MMLTAVAISGSPSPRGKSRRLLEVATDRLARAGLRVTTIDLSAIPADDLLGRTRGPAIAEALDAVASARIVVVATPVYRASYAGLLKVFFDLFPPDALAGKVALALATGGGPGHALVIDHALRPLLSSVGALVVATGVYGTDAQFTEQGPDAVLITRVEQAVSETQEVSSHVAHSTP